MASTLPLSIPLSICASIYFRILHSPTHERKNKIAMSVSSAPYISCILLYRQVGNCESAFSAHFYSRFAASLPTPPLLLTRLIEQLTHAGSAVSRGGPSDRPPPLPNSFHRFPTRKGIKIAPLFLVFFFLPPHFSYMKCQKKKRVTARKPSGFFSFFGHGKFADCDICLLRLLSSFISPPPPARLHTVPNFKPAT